MSLVSPASVRPRAASAWIGPLASCSALGRPGSASQPPSAWSSAWVRVVGSMNAQAPSGAAMARPVRFPVPRPQIPVAASPDRSELCPCSASQALTSSGPRLCAVTSNPSAASVAGPSAVAATATIPLGSSE